MVIAERPHLFPSRTQKLSSPTPMVLGTPVPGRVGRRREYIILDSSTVEYAAVNRGVVGSNPTRGAKSDRLRSVAFFVL